MIEVESSEIWEAWALWSVLGTLGGSRGFTMSDGGWGWVGLKVKTSTCKMVVILDQGNVFSPKSYRNMQVFFEF